MLAQASAVASIEDDEYFKRSLQTICATRAWTEQQLTSLGFKVIPSKTNFLFVAHASIPAIDIMTFLREKKIIVRHFSKPKIDNYLRISIGTEQQMQQLINQLQAFL